MTVIEQRRASALESAPLWSRSVKLEATAIIVRPKLLERGNHLQPAISMLYYHELEQDAIRKAGAASNALGFDRIIRSASPKSRKDLARDAAQASARMREIEKRTKWISLGETIARDIIFTRTELNDASDSGVEPTQFFATGAHQTITPNHLKRKILKATGTKGLGNAKAKQNGKRKVTSDLIQANIDADVDRRKKEDQLRQYCVYNEDGNLIDVAGWICGGRDAEARAAQAAMTAFFHTPYDPDSCDENGEPDPLMLVKQVTRKKGQNLKMAIKRLSKLTTGEEPVRFAPDPQDKSHETFGAVKIVNAADQEDEAIELEKLQSFMGWLCRNLGDHLETMPERSLSEDTESEAACLLISLAGESQSAVSELDQSPPTVSQQESQPNVPSVGTTEAGTSETAVGGNTSVAPPPISVQQQTSTLNTRVAWAVAEDALARQLFTASPVPSLATIGKTFRDRGFNRTDQAIRKRYARLKAGDSTNGR